MVWAIWAPVSLVVRLASVRGDSPAALGADAAAGGDVGVPGGETQAQGGDRHGSGQRDGQIFSSAA